MISSLSTYIQFIAAIYVTICLDNMIGRRFWSPNYYEMVIGELSIFKDTISTPKQRALQEKIKNKAHLLDDRSRKRGCLMLFYCILLLLYCAFEPDFYAKLPEGKELLSYYFPFSIMIFVSLILPLFYHKILSRWIFLIITIAICTILFVTLTYFSQSIFLPQCLHFIVNSKLAIAILLPLPIIYQLYVNWLYSTAYLCHLRWEVRDEFLKYQKSKAAYEKKDKEMADESYYQAFTNILFNKPDNVLTELNKTLYEHLQVRCEPPSAYKLLKSWNSKKDYQEPSIPQSDTQEEADLPVSQEITPQTISSDFASLYIEYEKSTPKPKMKDFCAIKNIEYEAFHEYYRNKKKRTFNNK